MCNIVIVENGFRAPVQDCVCYQAVMRTFRHMSDEPAQIALEAALRVYKHHHPEDSKADALITVERWVADRHIH